MEPRRWGVYRAISKPGDVVVTIETRTKLNADSLSLRMDPDRYKDAASEVRSSLVTRLGSLPVRLAVVVCGGGYDWANQNTNSPPKKKKSGANDGGVGGAYAAPEARIGAFEVQVAFMSREKVPRAQPRGFRAGEGEEQQFDHVDTLHYEHLFSELQALRAGQAPGRSKARLSGGSPLLAQRRPAGGQGRVAARVRGLHPSEDDGRMGGPDPELLGTSTTSRVQQGNRARVVWLFDNALEDAEQYDMPVAAAVAAAEPPLPGSGSSQSLLATNHRAGPEAGGRFGGWARRCHRRWFCGCGPWAARPSPVRRGVGGRRLRLHRDARHPRSPGPAKIRAPSLYRATGSSSSAALRNSAVATASLHERDAHQRSRS